MFLKLISFHHVYHDVRGLVRRVIKAKREKQEIKPNVNEGTIFGINKAVYDKAITYPRCLSVNQFIVFICSPTCSY